jgi:RNA polymerase primary sigma factor
MGKIEAVLAQELGRTPTDAETALVMNDTEDNVRAARRMTSTEFSLDAPVERTDSAAVTFGERVAGSAAEDIEEHTDAGLQRAFIGRLFHQYLTPRERLILSMYYGLDHDTEPMTLERIGETLGVTRERVRQIRERAFEKLRRCPEIKDIQGFWAAA